MVKKYVFDCYAGSLPYLVEKASVYIRLRGSLLLNEFGVDLSVEQFTTLDAIATNPHICQRDLAKIVLKDRSNVSRILNILEDKDLIKRVTSSKQNRVVKMIEMTQKGRELLDSIAPKMKDDMNNFLQNFDESKLDYMKETLTAMIKKISENANIQI